MNTAFFFLIILFMYFYSFNASGHSGAGRRKSLEQSNKKRQTFTSPEDLSKNLKVTGAGVWIMLVGIVLTLLGILAWAVFGRLETKVEATGIGGIFIMDDETGDITRDGLVSLLIRDEYVEKVHDGQEVEIEGNRYILTDVDRHLFAITRDDLDFYFGEDGSESTDYTMYMGSFREGEKVFTAMVTAPELTGIYKANIIVDSIRPIEFITSPGA